VKLKTRVKKKVGGIIPGEHFRRKL